MRTDSRTPNSDFNENELLESLRRIRSEAGHDFSDEPSFQELKEQLLTSDPAAACERTHSLGAGATARDEIAVSWRAGERIGDYELLEEIARGAMGVVFRARQTSLNRIVALKLVLAGDLANEESVKRFQAEASAAAKLDHRAIVPVHEVGEMGGRHYYSMAYVDGGSLADRLTSGPLEPRQAAQVLLQVAMGIQYAHQRGVIHRDLKPSNILVAGADSSSTSLASNPPEATANDSNAAMTAADPDCRELPFEIKVADFGLAKEMNSDNDLTRTGQILGTPGYMPPEQARGDLEVGPSADIYSMGAVLYATLTGRPPFQAATALLTTQQVLNLEPAPPTRLNPSIPRDLETICLKCLQKQPEHRYGDAAALAADLRSFLNAEPIAARPVTKMRRVLLWARRNPTQAAAYVAVVTTIMSLVGLAMAMMQWNATYERARRLELDGELRELRLKAAETLAETEKQSAANQEYSARLSSVRQRAGEPSPGWTFKGLEDLRRAANLGASIANTLELRNEAATCLSGVDVRPIAEIPVPDGYEPHIVKFTPDGERLAIATLLHEFELCVLICRSRDGQIERDLRLQHGELGFDGIRHLTFLGDGDEVAITTRSGWLHRWDLRRADSEPQSIELLNPNLKPFLFDGPRRRAFFCDGDQIYEWPDLTKQEFEPVASLRADRMSISPDGGKLAVANDHVHIFDTRHRSLQQVIVEMPSKTAFSRNGGMIAGVRTESVELFDTQTGRKIRSISDPGIGGLHEDAASNVHFSPSGALLMTTGFDQKFKLWDTVRGQLLLSEFLPGANEVRAVFHPSENLIAATGDRRVILYALGGPSIRSTIAQTADPVSSFSVSASPERLAVSSLEQYRSTSIALWDFETMRLIDRWRRPVGFSRAPLSVTADGTKVAVADTRRSLSLWEFERKRLTGDFAPVAGRKEQQALGHGWMNRPGPSDTLLFQGSKYWRVVNNRPGLPRSLTTLGLPWERVDAAVNWGDGRAYFFHDDEFCEYDIPTGKVHADDPRKTAEFFDGVGSDIIDAATLWKSDTPSIIRGSEVTRLDPASRAAKGKTISVNRLFRPHKLPDALDAVYRRDAFGAETVVTQDSKVHLVQREAWGPNKLQDLYPKWSSSGPLDAAVNLGAKIRPSHRLQVASHQAEPRYTRAVDFSPDGTTLWTAQNEHDITAWSVPDLKPRRQWSNKVIAQLMGVGSVSGLDAGDRWVAVAVKSGTMNLLSSKTATIEAMAKIPSRPSCVTLDEEEGRAACGAQNGEVCLISVPDCKQIVKLDAHTDEVTALAFSPDGNLLVTGGSDRYLAFWQARDSYPLLLRIRQESVPQKLEFSADGTQLIVSLKGETGLRLWQLDRLQAELTDIGLGW